MANYKRMIGLVLFTSLAIGAGGCDSSGNSATGGASMEQLASAASDQQAADEKKAQEEAAAQPAAQQPAEPGRTKAGRAAVGEGGYLTAIVGARRHIMNEADRWPWIQAVQHFKAEHGRMPKDNAEFMSRIVEPLEINLGYKEEDEEFFYEPNEGDWGELYVVKKTDAPAQQ